MTVPFRWLFAICSLLAAALTARAQEPTAPPALAPATPPVVSSAATSAEPHPAGTELHTAASSEPQITWSSVRVNGPYIAMTFDDGPSAKLTPKLLDLLAERHIHVTFFLVGENAKAHPEIVKREVAEGHEVGNHSWDHPDLAKKSEADVRSQLDRTNDAIADAIGHPPTLFRPPYGSLTKDQRKWIARDYGFKIILWSVDPLDWKRPGPEIVHQRIVQGARNGAIILSHDIHPGTVEAMPATLDELLGKGFKFVTVSELIAMQLPPAPRTSTREAATDTLQPGPKPSPTPKMPDTITGSPE
jgi:peptidoglycan/xylan/chitin deacetylase (PgdA/CDA1 family)